MGLCFEERPKAATKYLRGQPSVPGTQLLNKFYDFIRFAKQYFLAKCKEVMDIESILCAIIYEITRR
jgi:hypothetical protein